MNLRCAHNACHAVLCLPELAAADEDRAATVHGWRRIAAEAIVITPRTGDHLAKAVTAQLSVTFAGRPWRAVFTTEPMRAWILGAGRADLGAWAPPAAQLGWSVTIEVPPLASGRVCSARCEAAVVADARRDSPPTFFGDDARTRAILAERARGQHDPQRDPERRVQCPGCGQTAFVPPLADPSRYLRPLGWRCMPAGFYCSTTCAQRVAPPAPPVDHAAVAERDLQFRATLARERAVHAPLKSDATSRGRGSR